MTTSHTHDSQSQPAKVDIPAIKVYGANNISMKAEFRNSFEK